MNKLRFVFGHLSYGNMKYQISNKVLKNALFSFCILVQSDTLGTLVMKWGRSRSCGKEQFYLPF